MSKQILTLVGKITGNIMGTSSINMKLPNMRKEQDFTVYPISKGQDWENITIQSDNRFGNLNILTGKGIMSAPHGTHAGSMELAWDMARKKATEFEVSEADLIRIKEQIKGTAGDMVGTNGVMYCDNTEAKMTRLF